MLCPRCGRHSDRRIYDGTHFQAQADIAPAEQFRGVYWSGIGLHKGIIAILQKSAIYTAPLES